MKCPFQWNEEILFSGKAKRHIFRNCDGDCAAYVPEQTVGQFTIPARCRMLDRDKQKKIGAQAHGGADHGKA